MSETSKTTVGEFLQARKTLPFVRSIAAELRDRMRAIEELETEVQREEPGADAQELAARLAVHRRELRMARKELARVGWRVERTEPIRLSWSGKEGGADLVWQPEDTHFYRVSA